MRAAHPPARRPPVPPSPLAPSIEDATAEIACPGEAATLPNPVAYLIGRIFFRLARLRSLRFWLAVHW